MDEDSIERELASTCEVCYGERQWKFIRTQPARWCRWCGGSGIEATHLLDEELYPRTGINLPPPYLERING